MEEGTPPIIELYATLLNHSAMANYKTTINVNGQKHDTLKDILPDTVKQLDILFIAKTPATKSVTAGHYFQGRQGQMFWNRLKEYGVLSVRPNTFEDENLIANNYGLTDIVKVPRDYGNEPSADEYKAGLDRILTTIKTFKPKIIVFVYKKVLDNILRYGFGLTTPTQYGFNQDVVKLFGSKVFVFPMPGTPCTTNQAVIAMNELQKTLNR